MGGTSPDLVGTEKTMSTTFHLLPDIELPIYRLDGTDYAVFYTPGCVCVIDPGEAEQFGTAIALCDESTEQGQDTDWASELWRQAEWAVSEAKRQCKDLFQPECLTLYMNNECNLRCVYCHAAPSPNPMLRLDLETVAAAADVVAENCRKKELPFYIVFHGGGEPTLHQGQVKKMMALIEAIAEAHGVELFRYVATNGVMPEKKAAWLARHFDLIGLSCDGPANIHDQQRPHWDGRRSLHTVERTGHVLREEGAHLHVRTTITQASLHHQTEIAEYISRQFKPEEIHFEPVYLGGRTGADTSLEDHHADEFAARLLEARAVARRYGIPLFSSGSRPGAIHGPYCHVFRNVINLVPGGIATACFKLTEAAQIREKGVVIGARNHCTGHFVVDHDQIQALRRRLDVSSPECDDCFNRYHCARECPDRCLLDDTTNRTGNLEPGFRCRVQKAISFAILEEIAERLWSEAIALGSKGPHGTAFLG